MAILQNYRVKNKIVCGTDESGRGPICGGLYAAAVVLPAKFNDNRIKDSKKLTPARRNELRKVIEENAVDYSVASVSVEEIEAINNIQQCCFLAMHRAISGLREQPGFIIVDGNVFDPYGTMPFKCFVGGDNKYYSIAAASILAKTYRDEEMMILHEEFPQYHWNENKGYLTDVHNEAIKEFGITKYHRKNFAPVKDFLLTMPHYSSVPLSITAATVK